MTSDINLSVINNNAQIKIVISGAALAAMLRGQNGPIYTDMLRRGQNVQDAARKQIRLGHVHGGGGRPNLRDTLVKRVVKTVSGDIAVAVGSDSPIALIHHEGTRPHDISSKTGKTLAFPGKSGGMVFIPPAAQPVHHPGTKPNRYLTDNLPLALR